MGIESRDYYRASRTGRYAEWGVYDLTPVVKYLIIANVVVFVLQIFVTREVRYSRLDMIRRSIPEVDRLLKERGENPETIAALKKKHPQLRSELEQFENEVVEGDAYYVVEQVAVIDEWGALDTSKVVRRGQVWRLLTHAFMHSRFGIFHILFNMLFLYWFGCTLESMYGSREFFMFYMSAVLIAALAYVALDLWTGSTTPAIGASGAIMGVTMLYATHFPRETIRLFWIIPIEMRWLMVFFVIWDLHPVLLEIAGQRNFSGIAHAAHLGGLGFGFAYAKFQWRLSRFLDRVPFERSPQRVRPRLRVVREPDTDAELERVDELLKKIYEYGQQSLTDDERELLKRVSAQIRNRRE